MKEKSSTHQRKAAEIAYKKNSPQGFCLTKQEHGFQFFPSRIFKKRARIHSET